jgi:beta-glucosidase
MNWLFKEIFTKKLVLLLLISCHLLMQGSIAQEKSNFSDEIKSLVEQLTLDEKISMLHGNSNFTTASVERLGIPEWKMSDGPHGVREELDRNTWSPLNLTTDYCTYLPTGTALSATWNPDLAYEFGKVLGNEARARGKDIILGPGINMHRTPLCGRNFEYMSEDPYLNSVMVVPYVKGVQEQDVAACVKHYAINVQEYERSTVNHVLDERTLREIYLPGYEAAIVEGQALTVMTGYNKVNGYWCSENEYLLTDILRNEWGFKGATISDWGGTYSTIPAANAGLDIEMGTRVDDYKDFYFADTLKNAVLDGKVDISKIDEKVSNILYAMFKTKVFDENRSEGAFALDEHFATSKKIAEEAVVLLKNDENKLPLNPRTIKSIAVIGENAVTKHAAGGGSSGLKTKYEISPLEGLRNKLDEKIQINYSPGYKETTVFDWDNGIKDTGSVEELAVLREEAVKVAAESELVLMFLGLNHDLDTEAYDRPDMKLPFEQDKLIEQVLEVNKNVVIVLIGGSPIDISAWEDDVSSIVLGWYAGSEAGNVFADILFGDVNPSGKLPFTFPVKLEDAPAHKFGDAPGKGLTVEHKEGIMVGYRYFVSSEVEPQFAFGHGLSYTNFTFNKIELNKKSINDDVKLTVALSVKNTGKVSGKEVVQLYIEDLKSSVTRPKMELKAFEKISLEPGEEQTVTFEINDKMLSFYDVVSKSWVAEPGRFKVHIGCSSDDIRLTSEFELINN